MKNAKPHICFVAPAAYPVIARDQNIKKIGGAEVQQSIIAKELVKEGYRISMICLDYGQEDLLEIDGIRIIKAHKPDEGIPVLRFIHPRTTSVWLAMKKADADIYYQRSAGFLTGIVSFFAKIHKKKFIYSGAHNRDFVPGKELIQFRRDKIIFRKGLKYADAVIAQNENQKELGQKNYNITPVIIPNAYKLTGRRQEIEKSSKDDGFILWISTIRELKRPEFFLELAKSLPQYRFKMIGGQGNSLKYFHEIEKMASQISNLDFLGFLPFSRTEDYFDSAVIFVNTSIIEGFPNTFLQAWARSIPTVSFFSPFPEKTKNRPGAYVVSISNAQKTIQEWMESAETRKKEGRQCKQYFANNHSLSVSIKKYEKLITYLLNG